MKNTNDKILKKAKLRMNKIVKHLRASNDTMSLCNIKLPNEILLKTDRYYKTTYVVIGLIMIITTIYIFDKVHTEDCILSVPPGYSNWFRPPEDCSMCRNITTVHRVSNISQDMFEKYYAYTQIPVIVTDAVQKWKAYKVFNFNFLKEFYNTTYMGRRIGKCFFFSYETKFKSLSEVFDMEPERANLSQVTEPWYIGWSTCYEEESNKLRSYYSTPYFLPKTSESERVDWFFMGGPGKGALMHVDSVRFKSWQAQLSGRKQWILAPPPECYYECNWIKFTVNPGEILVVDTNRWFHKTIVMEGEISLTIGAEYD